MVYWWAEGVEGGVECIMKGEPMWNEADVQCETLKRQWMQGASFAIYMSLLPPSLPASHLFVYFKHAPVGQMIHLFN